MSFILFFFCILFFIGIKFAPAGSFFDDHIGKEKSGALKGIFVILVFFRHCSEYVSLDTTREFFFLHVDSHLGQMIVTLFLFFSGYGVLESIKRKGLTYVKQIPYYRAFRVWLHFCIALLPFLVYKISIGKKVSIKQFVLSMLCWKSLGNSNWYIMGIVLSYMIAFLAFLIFSKNHFRATLCTTILTCILIMILIPVRPSRYYNTLLCFPLGMWYSLYFEKIENWLKSKSIYYYGSLLFTFIFYFITTRKRSCHVVVYEIAAISFVMCIVLLSMKVSLNNAFLRFLGNHVFSIYILQRLPMRFLKELFSLNENIYAFFFFSFAITIIISLLFDFAMKYVDTVFFPSTKKRS